jgi:hypothetical protein
LRWKALTTRPNALVPWPLLRHKLSVHMTCPGCPENIDFNAVFRYLSVQPDDPSFNAPVNANLFDDEEGEGYTLICSRPQKARRLQPTDQSAHRCELG